MKRGNAIDIIGFLKEITKGLEEESPIRIARKDALERLSKMTDEGDPRVIFEEYEKSLRKPIVVGNWSALYSVYSESIVLEHIPQWSQIERAVDIRKSNMRQEISDTVLSLEPNPFALFLANLFSRVDWATDVRMGKTSHDGGVDFKGYYIYHDKQKVPMFGQAKHWESKVGSEPIRTFIGSVVTKSAGKPCVGIYACTGGFTPEAEAEIRRSPFKLLRFDLRQLIDLMINSNVGVKPVYLEGMRLDGSFWEEISS